MGMLTNLQTSAKRLVNQYGEDVLYRQFGPPTRAAGGASMTRDETDYTLKMFLYDYDTSEIDGTMVQSTDSKAVFYSSDFVPKKNDEVFRGGTEEGERLMVISATRYRVEGGDALFELQVRG